MKLYGQIILDCREDSFRRVVDMGKIRHQTKSRTVTIHYDHKNVPLDFLVVDSDRVRKYCMNCPNHDHKWSCPPACDLLPENYKRIVLYWAWIDASDFGGVQNKEYIKVRAMNAILVSITNQIGHPLATMMVGRFLSSGSCKLCHPCTYPDQCKRPERAYQSLESTGIDIVRTMKKLDFKLSWYGKKKINQNYTHGTVVCGVLTNHDDGGDYVEKLFKRLDIKTKEKKLSEWI